MPVLRQDVQHRIHIRVPSHPPKIRLQGTDSIPAAGPAVASLIDARARGRGRRAQAAACQVLGFQQGRYLDIFIYFTYEAPPPGPTLSIYLSIPSYLLNTSRGRARKGYS